MGKVELTRKQAAVIEELKTKFSNEQIVANNVKYRIAEINHDHLHHELVKLNLDILIKALYIGYEVEEEFKVGDWAVYDNKIIGKVKKIADDLITIDVELEYLRDNGETAYVNTFARYFRHATPEEVAEEKERRWWKKHNRMPWELKVGDVLIYEDSLSDLPEVIEIVEVADDRVYFNDGDIEYMSDINLGYKVVCFAENRLDLQEM